MTTVEKTTESGDRLVAALETEVETVRLLADAAARKRDALVRRDLEALHRATADEEAVLPRSVEAGRGRLQALEALKLDPAEGESPLRAAGRLPAHGARVESLRLRLLEHGETLRRENRLNRALIEQSLHHIDEFFKAVAEASQADPRYQPRAKRPERNQVPVMVDRVA